jgi:hypothetical protein
MVFLAVSVLRSNALIVFVTVRDVAADENRRHSPSFCHVFGHLDNDRIYDHRASDAGGRARSR